LIELWFWKAEDALVGPMRVYFLDEIVASFENSPLVQRAFVGNFSGVERGWFLEQEGSLDAIRIAGCLRSK
jgi:hypothetical protein